MLANVNIIVCVIDYSREKANATHNMRTSRDAATVPWSAAGISCTARYPAGSCTSRGTLSGNSGRNSAPSSLQFAAFQRYCYCYICCLQQRSAILNNTAVVGWRSSALESRPRMGCAISEIYFAAWLIQIIPEYNYTKYKYFSLCTMPLSVHF